MHLERWRDKMKKYLTTAMFGILLLWTVMETWGINPQPTDLASLQKAMSDTGASNIIAAYYLGYRLLDTIFEVFVFTTGATGVFYILGKLPSLEKHIPIGDKAFTVYAEVFAGTLMMAGLFLALTGHFTAGGAFVGGIAAATGGLFLILTMDANHMDEVFESTTLKVLETLVLTVILGILLLPIPLGIPPLHNFLPTGNPGTLASGGIIPILDFLIGIKVYIGATLITVVFVKHRGVF